MLVEFSVENFKSFKERHTFSLIASNDTEFLDENTFSVNEKGHLLKTALLYGANASGKSNFFAALSAFMHFAVLSGPRTQIGEKIAVTPFLFSQQTQDKPSSFELVFFIPDGEGHAVRYRYGFTIDADKVIEEHLFAVNKVRELMYFVRDGQDIEWNPSYFKEAAKLVKEQKVRPNAALLSVCAQDNGKIASSIIKYFQQYRVLSGLEDLSSLTYKNINDNADFDRIVQFLHFADLQILDLKKQVIPIDFSVLDTDIADFFKKKFSDVKREEILFGHAVYNENSMVGKCYLKEDEESLGTNKLFSYAGIIFDALDAGSVLFVDEFDSSLHPLIVENIIKLFNSPVHNPRNAQLVVSCQSVHTMTNKMLRRDQIWFCEKDRYGATDLYSLYDFDEPVRKDATFNKMYLQGKYGAVPDIDDIRLKGEMRG